MAPLCWHDSRFSAQSKTRSVGNVSNVHAKLLKLGVDVSQDTAQNARLLAAVPVLRDELTDLQRTPREFADGHL